MLHARLIISFLPSTAQEEMRTVIFPNTTSTMVSNITLGIASMMDSVGHCSSAWDIPVKDSFLMRTQAYRLPCHLHLMICCWVLHSLSWRLQLVRESRVRGGKKSLLTKHNVCTGCKVAGLFICAVRLNLSSQVKHLMAS